MSSTTFALVLTLLLAQAHPVNAATPIAVTVDTVACSELDSPALAEQIGLELGASFAVAVGGPTPGGAHANIRCRPSAALVSLSWDHTTETFTLDGPLSPRAVGLTVASRLQRVIARLLDGEPPVAGKVSPGTPVQVTDGTEARAANRVMIPGIVFLSAAGLTLTVSGALGIWHLTTTRNDDGVLQFYSTPFAITGAILAAIGLPLAIVGGVRNNRAKHWVVKPQVNASLGGLRVTF